MIIAFFAVQACSILYKTQLPLLLVFNKTDVTPHEFALEWMRESDSFSEALDTDTSYASQLSRSLSLVRSFAHLLLCFPTFVALFPAKADTLVHSFS